MGNNEQVENEVSAGSMLVTKNKNIKNSNMIGVEPGKCSSNPFFVNLFLFIFYTFDLI